MGWRILLALVLGASSPARAACTACAGAGCAGYERLDTSRSKFVQAGAYSAAGRCLFLTLEGAAVRHCGVPASIWTALKKAPDMGLYYNLNIAGHYACHDAGDAH